MLPWFHVDTICSAWTVPIEYVRLMPLLFALSASSPLHRLFESSHKTHCTGYSNLLVRYRNGSSMLVFGFPLVRLFLKLSALKIQTYLFTAHHAGST